MNKKSLLALWLAALACASIGVTTATAPLPAKEAAASVKPTAANTGAQGVHADLLAMGLEGAFGSAIGPDGALYVTESAAGRVARVNPKTGAVRTFVRGLPKSIIGLGGATDIAFIGRTAYVLVTLVGPDVGGTDVVGIYRIDGPHNFTVVADIGAFALSNPPATPFDVPTGLQFALEPYRGGFLVTDGHHNRVLHVTLDGTVTELIAFDNIVPTGLAVSGRRVFMAEAGPLPHLPEDGKAMLLLRKASTAIEVASGARLLVDVEFGPGHALYGLSQGEWPLGNPPGSPALPHTGALVKARWDGTFAVVKGGLNLPTSLEFIGNTAYVVSLAGEVWTIDLGHPHHWDD